MPRMTGGQALVKSLYREGVRVIFGIPGVQLYHVMDALYDEPGIRFVSTRHEQAAAYMAYGYSSAGGDVGTALVVPGPGLLNASAAVGTAYAASTPILIVSGQIPREAIGQGRGYLHEVDDQIDAIGTVTKWATRVLRPADVPSAVHQAFRHLRNGRPRPVEIEVPPDTLGEVADVELLEPATSDPTPAGGESIRRGGHALLASASPAILAGGGVVSSGASAPLLEVAEHLQALVYTTDEGKGSISDRHYLSAGGPRFSSRALPGQLAGHDTILAVGARMGIHSFDAAQRLVHIDIDPEELARGPGGTLGLEGDARRTLEELYRFLSGAAPPRPSRRAELETARAARFEPSNGIEPQGSYVRAIRAAIPDDGIVVEGVTQIGYACRALYPVYEPRTYITTAYFGNLGYAYPTALGAKVAQPDRAVVAISGDGGFLYNSQELATAVMHGINVAVIVFNDNAYGNVLRDQKTHFGGRVIGSELHNPDFVKLAQAYGARGVRVREAEDLESALREALEAGAPTLIEVPVGPMPFPS